MNEITKKKSNLSVKDLVNIGIFTLLLFVLSFLIGMVSMTIIGFLIYPALTALITGTITHFYLAKVQKKWAIFITALFPGALMTAMGHTPVTLIHSLIIAILAESVHRIMGLNKASGNTVTHAIFTCWTIGSFWQIYLMSEQYRAMTEKMMGTQYANALLSLPWWILPVLYTSCFVCGIIGGKIGEGVLKKHFKKAGIL